MSGPVMKLRPLHPATVRATAASMACLVAAICAAPVVAENGAQIAITGHVAPRCWVSNPASLTVNLAQAPSDRRAVCNQSAPRLVSEIRALGPDGRLVKRTKRKAGTAAALSPRTALEIVVSPQV